jgi:predicted outer membrane protein
MKNVISFLSASLIAVACSFSIQSCEEKKPHDSAEEAKILNDKKFDTHESEDNAKLMEKSAECNYAIIALSKLAEEKAVHKDVKALALELAASHHLIAEEIKGVAEKEGISIPTGPSDKAEDKIRDLSNEDAHKFDKEWTEKLIHKHKKAIEEMEEALKEDKIHPIEKEWVNKVLPVYREHLDKLTAINDKLKS